MLMSFGNLRPGRGPVSPSEALHSSDAISLSSLTPTHVHGVLHPALFMGDPSSHTFHEDSHLIKMTSEFEIGTQQT